VWNPQSPNQAKPLPAAVPPKGCNVNAKTPSHSCIGAVHHGKPALRHVPLHEQQQLSKTGQSDASTMQPLRSARACSRDGGGVSRSVHHHTSTPWLAAPEHAHKLHNLLAPKPHITLHCVRLCAGCECRLLERNCCVRLCHAALAKLCRPACVNSPSRQRTGRCNGKAQHNWVANVNGGAKRTEQRNAKKTVGSWQGFSAKHQGP
jgi:hypothetical protein